MGSTLIVVMLAFVKLSFKVLSISKEEVIKQYAGAAFSVFKPALAELAVSSLSPMSDEMRRLNAEPDYIDAVLRDGAVRANAIAAPILKDIKETIGFII